MSNEWVERILHPNRIREQAARILELSQDGRGCFDINQSRLNDVAKAVAAVTKRRFPDLKVPFHSRWTHLEPDSFPRLQKLKSSLEGTITESHQLFEFICISVLLDAGAGTTWKFTDPESGAKLGRSEGLALASWHLYFSGGLSADPKNPLRADADRLVRVSEQQLAKSFQHTAENKLLGLSGRVILLNNLGRLMKSQSQSFPNQRLGDLVTTFLNEHPESRVEVRKLLRFIQKHLGPIWPGRTTFSGVNLGDTWSHSHLGQPPENLVPFHKLSQWLTYSVMWPLELGGKTFTNFDELTPLAEYRNGGLLIDYQVLVPKPREVKESHAIDSRFVVEWRSLTVALLDRCLALVRDELNKQDLVIGQMLEGGTWWAGREIAAKLRPDGASPVKIISDGTVF